MPAFLDLPDVRARLVPISVPAYELLEEQGLVKRRTELLRGLIVHKEPKTPLHCTLNRKIYLDFLALEQAGYVVYQDCPLRLADSITEADVVILRGKQSDFATQHPTTAELVVEIATDSAAIDREKASLYAEAGVPEYWIVPGNEQQVEVYRRLEDGVYRQRQLYSVGEMLACTSVPDLQVTLADWFA